MTQPNPIPNSGIPVWDLVIKDLDGWHHMPGPNTLTRVMEDMAQRDQVGRARYGVPLQTFNGRDALQDAYEEALDQTVYLKQALLEADRDKVEPKFHLRLNNLYWNTMDNCLSLRSLIDKRKLFEGQEKVLDKGEDKG